MHFVGGLGSLSIPMVRHLLAPWWQRGSQVPARRYSYLTPAAAQSGPGSCQLASVRSQSHDDRLPKQGPPDAPFHNSFPEGLAHRSLLGRAPQVAAEVPLRRRPAQCCIRASLTEELRWTDWARSRRSTRRVILPYRGHLRSPQFPSTVLSPTPTQDCSPEASVPP